MAIQIRDVAEHIFSRSHMAKILTDVITAWQKNRHTKGNNAAAFIASLPD